MLKFYSKLSMNQPNLFEQNSQNIEIERLVLYALGEFQARKKVLAERELALDRLRGAFRRAAEFFETDEPNDDLIAKQLEQLGAKIVKVANYVAKHPYRVTVHTDLAERSVDFYQREIQN